MTERVGAAVVVWRRATTGGREVLVLHRTGADPTGPWCWTPPSGGCEPGESSVDCARRELVEETGLDLALTPVSVPSGYPVFRAEAPVGAVVVLDGEHDEHRWVGVDEALALLEPEVVAESLRAVVADLAG